MKRLAWILLPFAVALVLLSPDAEAQTSGAKLRVTPHTAKSSFSRITAGRAMAMRAPVPLPGRGFPKPGSHPQVSLLS